MKNGGKKTMLNGFEDINVQIGPVMWLITWIVIIGLGFTLAEFTDKD